jgi:SAM-dependent methyltransferase
VPHPPPVSHPLPEGAWNVLNCGQCGHPVNRVPDGAECPGCKTRFGRAPSGSLDLRSRQPRPVRLDLELEPPQPADPAVRGSPFRACAEPAVDFSGRSIPNHLDRETLSWFPKAASPGSLALDVGCGDGAYRGLCEHAGFGWVGLDIASPEAPVLADAHALPFQDGAFEFVLAVALLEHVRFPLLVTREAWRVLKPGGRFIGSVAFLEPFHGDSHYHHTHLGVVHSLRNAGFHAVRIAPSRNWPVLLAQARMGLFPGMPTWLSRGLVLPLHGLHRLWWRAGGLVKGRSLETARVLATAGSFAFIADKDPA